MTWEAELSTVRALLRNNWSTTAISWPGEHFAVPDRTGDRTAPGAFVKPVWNHNPSVQMAMATTGVRNYPGLLTIMIFIEPDVGTKLLRNYADTISAIFRDHTSADRIWFLEPWYRFHGTDGEWIRADLNIPFERLHSFGVTDPADLAGGVSDPETVAFGSAHGFSVGDWLTYDTAAAPNVWSKAVADGVANLEMVGLVSRVPDTDSFDIVTGTSVVITAHGETLGPLYLDTTTAGTVTTTKPTSATDAGAFMRQVGVATTANRITVTQIVAIRL